MNKIKKTKNAVIYTRTSNLDRGGDYLANQKLVCQGYCRQKGIKVDKIFSDIGTPALNWKTRGLSNVVKYCKKNKPDILIVADMERLSRSVDDYKYLEGKLSKAGTVIYSVRETK